MKALVYRYEKEIFKTTDDLVKYHESTLNNTLDIALILYGTTIVGQINVHRLSAEVRRHASGG